MHYVLVSAIAALIPVFFAIDLPAPIAQMDTLQLAGIVRIPDTQIRQGDPTTQASAEPLREGRSMVQMAVPLLTPHLLMVRVPANASPEAKYLWPNRPNFE